MALSDYNGLQLAIADWSNRTDLTAQIIDFITLAEARINNDLRVQAMISQATGSLTTGETTLAQPSDFLQVELFQVSSNPAVVLEARPSGEAVAADNTSVGGPKVYTIVGTNFEILPAPDNSYTYTLDYYAKVPALA